jgi:hypothetical protein
MNSKKMHDQLEMIDGAIAELEERRTELINRIDNFNSRKRGSSRVLQFSSRVTVKRAPRGSATDWPRGSEASSPDKDRP